MSSVLLSTAYLPPIYYLSQVINNEKIVIEKHEHFVKQTYRSRCDVVSSSGALRLSIPLVQFSEKERISQKRISYAEKWQHQHWRTITTAYKNSPYFEFFEHEFKPFYETQYEFLFDYNTRILETILGILRIRKQLLFTSEFELNPSSVIDLRSLSESTKERITVKPYYQVFEDKLGFVRNVSCLDALFNIGLETRVL